MVVAERDAGFTLEVTQPAPRDIVWSFVTDPAIRPRWQAGVTAVDELPTAPRTRVRILFTWGRNRREREELSAVRDFVADVVGRGQAALHDVLAEEMARRATLADAPPEPATPTSLGRE